ENCEARLLSVERISEGRPETILDEPIYCRWSNVPNSEQIRTTIPSGVAQPANLFSAHHKVGIDGVQVQAWPSKAHLSKEIQAPGGYRLRIAVSAKNSITEHRTYIFTWNDYDSIRIRDDT